MCIVGTFKAKTNFTKLIKRVREGEEILITRRGEPVAKIPPLKKELNTDSIRDSTNRTKLLSKQMQLGKFDREEWKSYRDIWRK